MNPDDRNENRAEELHSIRSLGTDGPDQSASLRALRRTLVQRDAEVEQLRAALAEAVRQVHELHHSLSWRWTAPARAVLGVLMGLSSALFATRRRAVALKEPQTPAEAGSPDSPSEQLDPPGDERASLDARVLKWDATHPAPPRVSVIIPCFDQGAFIDEAVDSVLEQTLPNTEILVINDGSSDRLTNDLLSTYRRPRTTVITTPHRGLAAARNLGIRAAAAPYVCALDADDKLAPTLLERAVAILDADESIAFVSCWLQMFGTKNDVWQQRRCDLPTLLSECTVCTAAPVRRSALQMIGGYDEHMPEQGYEDWDLWISLVERGLNGVIIPEVLFHYRIRPGSMSSVCCSPEVHPRLMRYIFEKHQQAYDKHLADVLLRRDAEAADLLRVSFEIENEIETAVRPALDAVQAELTRLQKLVASSADPSAVNPKRPEAVR